MIIIKTKTPLQEIKNDHNHFFESMVKGVADINNQLIALDADLHADLEELLLEEGSNQADLWGFNIFLKEPNQIEYTSLINIRPTQGNRSMKIEDDKIKKQVEKLIHELIQF